jgi:hypothetical protein
MFDNSGSLRLFDVIAFKLLLISSPLTDTLTSVLCLVFAVLNILGFI